MLYLHVEDIVVNAMIELNKINGERGLPVSLVERYGLEVIQSLNEMGFYTKLKVNQRLISKFEDEYEKYFYAGEVDDEYGYILKSDKSPCDLEVAFRTNLDKELIDGYTNDEAIMVLRKYASSRDSVSSGIEITTNNKHKKRVKSASKC